MKRVTEKHTWEPMRLTAIGKIDDVVRGGGGKLSAEDVHHIARGVIRVDDTG